MNNKDINRALDICDDIMDNESNQVARQVASTLFQRTLETKRKSKWSSSEDDLVRTFFYLTSKEELCESLQCDMESLYRRARHLGVVSPAFQTLTSTDLITASALFADGYSQEKVLEMFGIDRICYPARGLDQNVYSKINQYIVDNDNLQMDLFSDED